MTLLNFKGHQNVDLSVFTRDLTTANTDVLCSSPPFLFLPLLFRPSLTLPSLSSPISFFLSPSLSVPSLSPSVLSPSHRYFEVISSSRKSSVFLRAKDPAMAQSWYNAIQAGVSALVPRVRDELRAMQAGLEVKHMGWITEQVQRVKGEM